MFRSTLSPSRGTPGSENVDRLGSVRPVCATCTRTSARSYLPACLSACRPLRSQRWATARRGCRARRTHSAIPLDYRARETRTGSTSPLREVGSAGRISLGLVLSRVPLAISAVLTPSTWMRYCAFAVFQSLAINDDSGVMRVRKDGRPMTPMNEETCPRTPFHRSRQMRCDA